jgi:amino acid transporter
MYMKNNVILYSTAIPFIAVNILIMVITAMPNTPNSIPRWYWPITVLAVLVAALVYWSALMIPRLKWSKGGRTLGAKIGFEVHVYEEGDDDIPENMRFLMWEAKEEGSRRRLKYKVRRACRTWSHVVERLTANFLSADIRTG